MRTCARTAALVVVAGWSLLVAAAAAHAAAQPASRPASRPAGKPAVYLIGDSTVKNGAKGQKGWGEMVGAFLDPAKIDVVNAASGGRSSRTFLTEKRWDKVMADLRPGDVVLMQFGHNDGGDPQLDPNKKGTGRGSLRGTGEETREVTDPATGAKETVHTYGWYLRQYVRGAKSKGATPVVCSPVPRNDWKDGKVLRADQGYGKHAREVAAAEGAAFIDLNEIVARSYERLGQEKVAGFFPDEHTHTNEAGAALNAECAIAGVKGLKGSPLARMLPPAAGKVEASDAVADAPAAGGK